MFCTECGKKNEDTNKFCYNCGGKLLSEKAHITSFIPNEDSSSINQDKIPIDVSFSLYNDTVKIKEGGQVYTTKNWKLADNLTSLKAVGGGSSSTLYIPIEEIISLTSLDTKNSNGEFYLGLSDGNQLTVEMDVLAFNALHKSFTKMGNKPNYVALPTEIKSVKTPSYLKVLTGLIVVGVLIVSFNSETNSSKNHNELTQLEMKSVCKSYIAQNFRKPENIITTRYIKEDVGVNFISASYVRSSDNSKWEYVCSITGNKIIWASIREDGSVGRWRYEDSREIINGRVKV